MSEAPPPPTAAARTPVVTWADVWADVANQLREHRAEGRGHLLTEDSVRLCLVMGLGRAGVHPSRLTVEVPAAGLGRGKLDLTVDGAGGTVVELKFPRDARGGISPDTMTMGEMLRDFLRVASVRAHDRWVVQVVNDRLRTYLAGSARGLGWPFDIDMDLELREAQLLGLPPTARTAVGVGPWAWPLQARCVAAHDLGDGLGLYAYRVTGHPLPAAAAIPPPVGIRTQDRGRPAAWQPDHDRRATARVEILAAIDELTTSARPTVTVAEVVQHLHRRGTTYADSTIRTMMTAHMCVDASGPGISSYDDLERVARGEYRRRSRP